MAEILLQIQTKRSNVLNKRIISITSHQSMDYGTFTHLICFLKGLRFKMPWLANISITQSIYDHPLNEQKIAEEQKTIEMLNDIN